MWDFLGKIVSGFLLLRDFFGYLIPGVVFAGLMLYSGQYVTAALTELPAKLAALVNWPMAIVFVIACYIAGHVLVAAGYTLSPVVGAVIEGVRRIFAGESKTKIDRDKKPVDHEAAFLYYEYLYPSLFIEIDRRDTIHMLRLGVAMALIAGPWLLAPCPRDVLVAAGLFMLYNSTSGQKHMAEMKSATLQAARMAEKGGSQPHNWT